MPMGDPPNPEGMIWTDAAGWVPAPRSPTLMQACDLADVPKLKADIEALRARLAMVKMAVTETAGDAERSEFHRGWAACCAMVAAVARDVDEQSRYKSEG